MTDDEWKRDREIIDAATQVARDARGFEGEWVFDPAHTEDHGIGNVGEFHDFDDRLMFVPLGDSVRDETAHCIIDEIDQEVAEPMCRMLNWAGGLARQVLEQNDRIAQLEALLVRAVRLANRFDLSQVNGDWACRECRPHSDMLKDGFVCDTHALRNACPNCEGDGYVQVDEHGNEAKCACKVEGEKWRRP